jgi:hypothetical protein
VQILPASKISAENTPKNSREVAENPGGIEAKQRDEACPPSPSPSPSKKEDTSNNLLEGAGAPLSDPEKELFRFGKLILGQRTGGLIVKLRKRHAGDVAATMRTLRLAANKHDPKEYVAKIVHSGAEPETDWDAEYRKMGVSL